jgi:hypothetical protein
MEGRKEGEIKRKMPVINAMGTQLMRRTTTTTMPVWKGIDNCFPLILCLKFMYDTLLDRGFKMVQMALSPKRVGLHFTRLLFSSSSSSSLPPFHGVNEGKCLSVADRRRRINEKFD